MSAPTSRLRAARIAIACALLLPAALRAAEPGPDAQREIAHLLRHLETSQCAFYRNGTWHSSAQARAHLEEKYRHLRSASRISSAEDFVALAATASSTSGVAYQVRCNGKEPVGSAQWLEGELRRYRASRRGK